jgi:hypothetical protein
VNTFLATEEATEAYFRFDDICGRDTSQSLFDTFASGPPKLTMRGLDYLRFGALMARP